MTRGWGLFWAGWFLARVLEEPTALRAIGLAVNVFLAAMPQVDLFEEERCSDDSHGDG